MAFVTSPGSHCCQGTMQLASWPSALRAPAGAADPRAAVPVCGGGLHSCAPEGGRPLHLWPRGGGGALPLPARHSGPRGARCVPCTHEQACCHMAATASGWAPSHIITAAGSLCSCSALLGILHWHPEGLGDRVWVIGFTLLDDATSARLSRAALQGAPAGCLVPCCSSQEPF